MKTFHLNKPGKILIVGQGLAGTLLSYQFLKNNIQHKVVDNQHANSSTLAAAGLINPVTGRRYVKSWMIDELLEVAKPFYHGLEQLLDMKLVSSMDVIRSLKNVSQENLWNTATSRPGYKDYVSDDDSPASYAGVVNHSFTYRRIRKAMQVDVSGLIVKYSEFLLNRNMLIQESFDYSQIYPDSDVFEIYGETYSHIIFCEGYKAIDNPFFNFLPFQPSKGESFEIEINGFEPDEILRDEIFLVPVGESLIWSGGGYGWDFTNKYPTEDFRTEWSNKLDELLQVEYRIKSHKAGIRPGVKGRRPLLGRHPEYNNLIIFNGLGTKGTSLGPYFSKHLYEYLFEEKELLNEVNIQRFVED